MYAIIETGGKQYKVQKNDILAVETNVAKCSQLIADDISDKNANTLSAVNEGDL